MNKVVAYCRFSSSLQREESIEAQVRAIKDYCCKNNYNLIKIYKDEGISGTSIRDREAFLELIKDSKNKMFKYVIVHKFDRFARNRYDHAIYEKKLNDNGVKLLSVLEQLNDSPESVILKSVLTGMNEYYSLNLSREVKKGLKENALKGKHSGGIPPLGYDLNDDRKYVINEKEAEAVRLIFDLALKGVGYASIANELNSRGYRNKLGREFRKVSIRDTLLNIKYIGTFYHGLKDSHGKLQKNPIIIENNHEAIVDKDIFYKVQQKFKTSKRKPRKRKKMINNYLLTGFCTCGECGGTYSGGYRSKNRDGTISYGYYCRHRKEKINSCKNKGIRKELIENAIIDIIKNNILDENNIKIMVSDIKKHIEQKNNEKEVEYYRKEIKKLKEKLLKLLEKNLEGIIEDELFKLKNIDINSQILTLKERLYSLEKENKKDISERSIEKYLQKIKKETNEDTHRNLIESFVKNIKIFQDRIEVTLRRFPKELQSSVSVKVGGSGFKPYITETLYRINLYNKIS